ncbi:MAG: S8 family serine peptidase [Puniceicoccaceae bacterium]
MGIRSLTSIFRSVALLGALLTPCLLVAADKDPNTSGSGGNWLIKVAPGSDAEETALAAGAVYIGPLKGVDGYHRVRFFRDLASKPDEADWKEQVFQQLAARPEIETFEEDILIVSYPKVFNPADPLFPDQWHLENAGQSGGVPFADARVRPAWDRGLSGEGVVIAIVDEGTQYTHPDLQGNYLSGSGYDYNDDDFDPSPSGINDQHGTAVAGISLADANGIGGLGIAYDAKLVPLRLIAGPYALGEEAEALSYRSGDGSEENVYRKGFSVDIYNNSWGPSDDFGVRYADSSTVLKDALRANSSNGRGGLGNIYVWAAGNGGLNGDNSNYDGYNSLPWTISVGAVGDDNIRSGYSEPGANLLVVAPSGGRGGGILTTDNTGFSGYAPGDEYEDFSGTSAAAPMVSGVVALMLEHRPDLNWRDVQQILALTATPVDFSNPDWSTNAAGLWVNHEYGFGRVDADAATQLATVWPSLGTLISRTGSQTVQRSLFTGIAQESTIAVASSYEVQFVRVTLRLNHSDWGDIRVVLESPSGTQSVLAEPHANANGQGLPGQWTYLSTRHLGEPANGNWKLIVTDDGTGGTGSWTSWSIDVMGHDTAFRDNSHPTGDDLFIETTDFPMEIDILDGLTDPDGDSLEILAVAYPQFSTLRELENGRFSFNMGESKNGWDSFGVLVGDGKGGVLRRMVEVLDPRPVAVNDLYPVTAGATLDLPILSNDRDPDGDPLRILSVTGPNSQFATILETGVVRYTVPLDFTGVARLKYELTDDSDGQSAGWITLVVQDSPELAIQFDGEDDYLRVPPTFQIGMTDNFTAEAWIYPETFGEYVTGFGRIFDRDTFVFFLNGFDHSFYNDRSLVLYVITSDGRAFAINSFPLTINLNRWQHVAVTYNSSDSQPVRMYVDGSQVAVDYPTEVSTTRPSLPISDNRNSPLFIGESDNGARAFNGRMTEFRIWNRVLPASTIADLHDQRLTGSETGLQLYLPLDQTLDSFAVSTGSFKGQVDIFEAQRVPLTLPWNELENHYKLLSDYGNGWWTDRTLGWLYGDAFPWIYTLSLGWAFTGHGTGSNTYFLYPTANNWGWLQTSGSFYPWFYRTGGDSWLWYLEGSALFYDTASSQWVGLTDDLPSN